MKRFLFFIAVSFVITACLPATSPTPIPTETPNPGEIALQMVQQQMAAEATAQIVSLQFSATAQVIAQTATVQAYETEIAITNQARIDAQATANQALLFVQATQQRIDAESTQAQERLNLEATQEAEATTTAFIMTQAVIPTHNLWTQEAVEQDMIIATNEVELSNLEVERRQQTNTLDWVVRYSVIAALTFLVIRISSKYFKIREVKNADGEVELVIYDNDKAIKPSLLPKPVLILDSGEMPDVTTAQEQSDIVRRDQGIKALANMPVNPTGAGANTFNNFFGESEKPSQPYEIVDGDAIPAGLLDGETIKALESDWKEDQHE